MKKGSWIEKFLLSFETQFNFFDVKLIISIFPAVKIRKIRHRTPEKEELLLLKGNSGNFDAKK